MSFTRHRWTTITATAVVAVSAQLTPALARADLHNITYIAHVDGVAPGTVATFITADNQTNMAQLGTLPGNSFQANAVLPDPHHAGMQVAVKWPYSANVHCEIDVDDKVFVQVDQVVHPAPGSTDPMNGVLPCGAPLPNP
ncbi:hypothetical protein [Mycobacterium sp.]|uniref:hypothetical protein n=1 Tax=Mycobacterium sp. TaxID=1785 RepID=UPI003BB1E9B9